MTFHIITIFPEIFNSYFSEGILKRAQKEGKVEIKIYNLRDFTEDKHKTVDDMPYGGGPGMVLKVGPIFKCVERIKQETRDKKQEANKSQIPNSNLKETRKIPNSIVVLTSAKGKAYTQDKAEDLKKYSDIIIICGRYEGVDERVAEHIADEEISIGRYVLTGGELPAMVIVDSISRLIPEVLGNEKSLNDSKFNPECSGQNSKFEKNYSVYTRPEEFQKWKVPDVLLSGNHAEIEKWRSHKGKT